MKMTTSIRTLTTRIRGVEKKEFMSKNGVQTAIVLIKTDSGTFANYLNIWKKQNINLDEVQAGDDIMIEYTTFYNWKKSRTFRNFQTVKLCQKDTV